MAVCSVSSAAFDFFGVRGSPSLQGHRAIDIENYVSSAQKKKKSSSPRVYFAETWNFIDEIVVKREH